MNIRKAFPKFNVPVKFIDAMSDSGQYWERKDIILLNRRLTREMPGSAKLVLLHEMIHASGAKGRLNRFERLERNFGEYKPGSLSYCVEECIAEVGCMVLAMKLGLLNQYSQSVIFPGLEKHYKPEMYIPIREVRAAVRYFADDESNFEEEIKETKLLLEAYMDIKFQDTYTQQATA